MPVVDTRRPGRREVSGAAARFTRWSPPRSPEAGPVTAQAAAATTTVRRPHRLRHLEQLPALGDARPPGRPGPPAGVSPAAAQAPLAVPVVERADRRPGVERRVGLSLRAAAAAVIVLSAAGVAAGALGGELVGRTALRVWVAAVVLGALAVRRHRSRAYLVAVPLLFLLLALAVGVSSVAQQTVVGSRAVGIAMLSTVIFEVPYLWVGFGVALVIALLRGTLRRS